MQELMADDVVVGNSQGQVLNKEQFLARLKDPERIIKIVHSDDFRVKVYGEVAIMTESNKIQGTDHGKPFGGDFRFLRVFHKQDGKWRVVLAQGTPLPAAK